MLLLRVIFTCILMLLAGQISESLSSNLQDNTTSENCKNIRDYEPCLKNTCPEYMPCYCREKEEYCRCINFKGPLGDYWNLGPKCDQQWNSLDLILIGVVPGICLTTIVAACMCCVYSHKKRNYLANATERDGLITSETKPKQPMMISNHQNEAFLNDEVNDQNLHGQQKNMRIPKVNAVHIGQMEHIHHAQMTHVPQTKFSYREPESNIAQENFSPPMTYASSSHYEGQHSIPQFHPINGYPEQNYRISHIKRPEMMGIQVLPAVGPRQNFGMKQLGEDPGYQQFYNPV
ncbi:uncharacterized protein LOC144683204 [Cetorhinus maximus]